MRISCLLWALLGTLAPGLAGQDLRSLSAALEARLAQDTAVVGVAYLDPVRRDSLFLNADHRFHAASTMKVPVLVELSRRTQSGPGRWDDPVLIRNEFRSIVDGSPYRLDPADDSDSTLYLQEGRELPLATLARLMIVRSSNLATNVLMERLDPAMVTRTARSLGADSIQVLRGVKDGKAFAQGLNNTTTARDLARLLAAIASGRAAGREATDSMVAMLQDQEFNEGIPAGLPAGVRVAHKTGWITGISHDAAIVFPPGRGPYVLVILTQGYGESREAARLMADLAALVHRWAMARPDPRE